MTYTYQPLPTDHKVIRILIVHPGKSKDLIKCSFETCSLPPEQGSEYEPISYCWGAGKNAVKIELDGHKHLITKNLNAALIRFRHADQLRRLWADALCINQQDEAEKSVQVRLMRDVYQHGSKTLVWLGEGDSAIKMGFAYIPLILDNPQKQSTIEHTKAMMKKEGGMINSVMNLVTTGSELMELRHVYQIFQLAYFSRVWIIQEIVLSSSVEFFYDADHADWDDLVIALGLIETGPVGTAQKGRSSELFQIIADARKRYWDDQRSDILNILVDHRSSLATNQKDKMYGLMGLMQPDQLTKHQLVPNYSADYTLKIAFTDLARQLVQSGTDLDILSAAGSAQPDPGGLKLASWVPNWGVQMCSFPLTRLPGASEYNISKGRTPEAQVDDKDVLSFRGHLFDEIGILGAAYPGRPVLGPELQNYHSFDVDAKAARARKNWLDTLIPDLEAHYSITETWQDAFLLTCAAGSAELLQSDPFGDKEKVAAMKKGPSGVLDRKLAWDFYHQSKTTFDLMRNLRQGKETSLGEDNHLFPCYGRRMFRSKNTYLGLAPKTAQKGDVLAFFEGAKVPFVIRRVDEENYQLIGECYLHGAMTGGLFDAERSTTVRLV